MRVAMGNSSVLLMLLSTALILLVSKADKDSSYYPYANFNNPNLKYKMYWKDSENVIEDLSEFRGLYIKFHSCVWTEMYSNDEDGDGGGGGDEDETWYLGSAPKTGANAAFSLYGTLKGESSGKRCNRRTYINSFFTTYGVAKMAKQLGIDTTYANSYCTSNGGSGDRNLGESGDGDWSQYESYGTGCSPEGKYTLDTFQGTTCDGSYYLETTDTLDAFNEAMEGIDCYQIYDSNSDNSNYVKYTNAYKILSKSSSCNVRMYNDGVCPDPYGLLATYTRNLDNAEYLALQGEEYKELPRRKFNSYSFFSVLFVLFGVGIFLWAYRLHKEVHKRYPWHKMKGKSKAAETGLGIPNEPRTASGIPLKETASSLSRRVASSVSTNVKRVASNVSQKVEKAVDAIQDYAEADVEGDDQKKYVQVEKKDKAGVTPGTEKGGSGTNDDSAGDYALATDEVDMDHKRSQASEQTAASEQTDASEQTNSSELEESDNDDDYDDDYENADVAETMAAERGVAAAPPETPRKKKRPLLNRLSQRLFKGRRQRKMERQAAKEAMEAGSFHEMS